MPVFELDDDLSFPRPELARRDGLLAVGGDLSVERLVLAYSNGIFPWFSEGDPILWWSPAVRPVLEPGKIHVGRSLEKAEARLKKIAAAGGKAPAGAPFAERLRRAAFLCGAGTCEGFMQLKRIKASLALACDAPPNGCGHTIYLDGATAAAVARAPASVSGAGVFARLKFESGGHRVQRVPARRFPAPRRSARRA